MKDRLLLLYTPNLDGLDIPTVVKGLPLVIVSKDQIDALDPDVYCSISVSASLAHGEATIELLWNFGDGLRMSSGLTLYCSKTGDTWKVDFGRGWAP